MRFINANGYLLNCTNNNLKIFANFHNLWDFIKYYIRNQTRMLIFLKKFQFNLTNHMFRRGRIRNKDGLFDLLLLDFEVSNLKIKL